MRAASETYMENLELKMLKPLAEDREKDIFIEKNYWAKFKFVKICLFLFLFSPIIIRFQQPPSFSPQNQ